MPAPISLPLAHAVQAFWWASKQGLEGVHDRITAEMTLKSLKVIYRAGISDRLTRAAEHSLNIMTKRRGERRGAEG